MWIADNWNDYEVVDTSSGEKLERWGDYMLVRPDPQVLWNTPKEHHAWKKPNGHYHRSSKGGGEWEFFKLPQEWDITYNGQNTKNLTFHLKPFSFKHTGLFPEQAVNWDAMSALIKRAVAQDREIKVLNLFAYTGAASVACAKAGAKVTHVDAAKGMVERAGENAKLSGIDSGIRYIVDDCMKFVAREIRRGNKYDAIIMDPPSYGRGPGGEMWKIERDLFAFVENCACLLSDNPLFFLINSYTTGLQPAVLSNILTLALKNVNGRTEAYEVGIATDEGIPLPCGASGLFVGERYADK